MTFRDLIDLSVYNLWRIKLRAFLTVAGVVIAIATLVAMLSFAAGNQKWITTAYEQFGLLSKMNVYPGAGNADSDTSSVAILDGRAVGALSEVPGVKLVYPFVDYDVTAAVGDTVITSRGRVLSVGIMTTQTYKAMLAGAVFTSDDAGEAVVTREFLDEIGVENPDSVVGKRLVVSTRVASIDSALFGVFGDANAKITQLFRTVRFDSLSDPGYQRRILQRELAERIQRFIDGFTKHRVVVSDTLIIRAVGPEMKSYRFQMAPIILPERTARRFDAAGFAVGDDPADLFAAMKSGDLFRPGSAADAKTYPRVTLELERTASASAVKDSVVALGFRAFSFAEQFGEIKRFFVYYYVGLGVLGVIALVTASLGIVNTMVMSITERRKEIGIFKSLGADEREIRLVFLAESAVIGAIGSAIGIGVGWLGTRVAAVVVKAIMEREDMPIFDPFTLPYWLVLLSLAFGILVSLLAGAYPSGRAARVDPVEALRSD